MKKRIVRIIECTLIVVAIAISLAIVKEFNVTKQNQEKFDRMYMLLLYATDLNIKVKADKSLLMCSQISSDWSNALKKGKDFNIALQNTLQTAEDGDILETLRDDKKSIEIAMNKLNKPPEQYEYLYDKLLSLYGQYTKLYEQATSPTGSMLTYNSSVKEIYSEITRLSNEFEVLVPQDIKNESAKQNND